MPQSNKQHGGHLEISVPQKPTARSTRLTACNSEPWTLIGVSCTCVLQVMVDPQAAAQAHTRKQERKAQSRKRKQDAFQRDRSASTGTMSRKKTYRRDRS